VPGPNWGEGGHVMDARAISRDDSARCTGAGVRGPGSGIRGPLKPHRPIEPSGVTTQPIACCIAFNPDPPDPGPRTTD
jgi:hypothetical protein